MPLYTIIAATVHLHADQDRAVERRPDHRECRAASALAQPSTHAVRPFRPGRTATTRARHGRDPSSVPPAADGKRAGGFQRRGGQLFTMIVTVGPTNVATGDPITVQRANQRARRARRAFVTGAKRVA